MEIPIILLRSRRNWNFYLIFQPSTRNSWTGFMVLESQGESLKIELGELRPPGIGIYNNSCR